MYRFSILLAVVIISLSSCTKTGDFELNLRPVYQQNPLILNEVYSFGDINLKFENLTFYISDVSLETQDGEEITLADAEFIALNAFDESAAMAGKSLSFIDLPAGNYRKLKFSIGVPPDLNAMSPSDFDVSSALGRTDHYWEPWGSYIFAKIEGNADLTGDGIFDLKFFYHTGSDALFRSFEIEEDIIIDADGSNKFELTLDYEELLKNADGSYFDIASFPRNHNPEDLDIIMALVDNYVKAFRYVK